jgi:hypothetical protein
MKFATSLLALLFALPALAADIKSDYDRSADLSQLKTFRFLSQTPRAANDPLAHNELVDKRLRSAIQQNLESLGLAQNAGAADFAITYRAVIQKQLRITASGGPYRFAGGTAWADDVYEGTVIVDFTDAKTGGLVWRGYVTTTLGRPDKSEEKINKDIKKLIARFAKDRKNQK